jgi:two-component system, NarL family, nitrate/nitrite response regulator NarL
VTGEPAGESRPIRLVIAAEIRLYREGIAHVLAKEPDVSVVGAAGEAGEALRTVLACSPDVALLDLGAQRGLAAVRALRREAPGVRLVTLGVDDGDDDVLAWAEAGVSGYVPRDASFEDLVETVRAVARGELRCSPRLAATLLRRVTALAGDVPSSPARLTQREREISSLLEAGLSNKEIASRLYIELPTVKNHVHNILRKVGASRRGEAAALLRRDALL